MPCQMSSISTCARKASYYHCIAHLASLQQVRRILKKQDEADQVQLRCLSPGKRQRQGTQQQGTLISLIA